MSAVPAQMLSTGDELVVVAVDRDVHDGAQAVVSVPWSLSKRDAQTTAAGAAALLLLPPEGVLVLSEPGAETRSLTDTLRAVAAAIREARS
jgi:hypothetical protein